MSIAEGRGGTTLIRSRESEPQGVAASILSIPTGLFFKGASRKVILQDLDDIKVAVERA